MDHVPTLHIRNVPEAVYKTLKRRAGTAGRSLNAEVIETLEAATAAAADAESLVAKLDALRREWLAPGDLPKPEELIRQAREDRTRHIERATRGL